MRHKVINSKDLGIDCWSSKRFFDLCDKCDRVHRCKLPESKFGRIKIAKMKVKLAKEIYTKAILNYKKEKLC